jgi:hypothetical protein
VAVNTCFWIAAEVRTAFSIRKSEYPQPNRHSDNRAKQ